MHFAIVNHDKPDSLDLRFSTREVHLDYFRGVGDALLIAEPDQRWRCVGVQAFAPSVRGPVHLPNRPAV